MKNVAIQHFQKFSLIILVAFLSYLVGCAPGQLKTRTPGEIDLARAKNFQKAGRYDLAIEHYSNIKNKYPLSPEAVEAGIELAETFYLQNSQIEARAGFESFIELHPNHKRVDFAAYRIGMSYYKQIPSTTDRDLTPATMAIAAFKNFLKNYPKSSYVKEAKAKSQDALSKLAEKEYYIASFYFKRKEYKAAEGRYRRVLKEYRGAGYDEKALFQLGMCYYNQESKRKAKHTLDLFVKKYSNSVHAAEAKKLLDRL